MNLAYLKIDVTKQLKKANANIHFHKKVDLEFFRDIAINTYIELERYEHKTKSLAMAISAIC